MAGLLTGLLEHPNERLTSDLLYTMCRFANAAGALATTMRGGILIAEPRRRNGFD